MATNNAQPEDQSKSTETEENTHQNLDEEVDLKCFSEAVDGDNPYDITSKKEELPELSKEEAKELKKLKDDIAAFTLPNRVDAQRVLNRAERLKWLTVQGIQTEDLADPTIQEHLSTAKYIYTCIDRSDKESMMLLQFDNLTASEAAKLTFEKQLPENYTVKLMPPKDMVDKKSKYTCDKLEQLGDIHVQNKVFLCVSDLPAEATDEDLAALFPSSSHAAVSRAHPPAITQSQRYGYIVFSSEEELEEVLKEQVDWSVDVCGKSCPLTYTTHFNIQKKLAQPLHLSQRRLVLERVRLLAKRHHLKSGFHAHLYALCNLVENDIAMRKEESKVEECTERINILLQDFPELLETVKQTEGYQKWREQRKVRGKNKEEFEESKDTVVTKGAETLPSTPKKNNRKKKTNSNSEPMDHQESSMEADPDARMGNAISNFRNTLGMLANIMAQLGPGQSQGAPQQQQQQQQQHGMNPQALLNMISNNPGVNTMNNNDHPPNQGARSKNPNPNQRQRKRMKLQQQHPEQQVDPTKNQIAKRKPELETTGNGGDFKRQRGEGEGEMPPAGRGKHYFQNQRKHQRKREKKLQQQQAGGFSNPGSSTNFQQGSRPRYSGFVSQTRDADMNNGFTGQSRGGFSGGNLYGSSTMSSSSVSMNQGGYGYQSFSESSSYNQPEAHNNDNNTVRVVGYQANNYNNF